MPPPYNSAPRVWSPARDAELTGLVRQGLSNQQIADQLGLTRTQVASRNYQLGLTRLGLDRGLAVCRVCAGPIDQPPRGCKRRYCSAECSRLARRSRRAAGAGGGGAT